MAMVDTCSDNDQHDFYIHALSLYKQPNFGEFFRYFIVPILYRCFGVRVTRRCVNHAVLHLRNSNILRQMVKDLHSENCHCVTNLWYPRGIRVDPQLWEYKLATGYWEVTKEDADLRTVAEKLALLRPEYVDFELRAVRECHPSKFQRMQEVVRTFQTSRGRASSI